MKLHNAWVFILYPAMGFFEFGELGSETCKRCIRQNKIWCDGFCEDRCYEAVRITRADACEDEERGLIGPGQVVETEFGLGVVHRYYRHLKQFTVLNATNEYSEYKMRRDGEMQPVYFREDEVKIIRDVRRGDTVFSHFPRKSTEEKSKHPVEGLVVNTTAAAVCVNFTSTGMVLTVPWDFVVG